MTDEKTALQTARSAVAMFTPDSPLILPKRLFEQAQAIPELADLMDRVKPNRMLP